MALKPFIHAGISKFFGAASSVFFTAALIAGALAIAAVAASTVSFLSVTIPAATVILGIPTWQVALGLGGLSATSGLLSSIFDVFKDQSISYSESRNAIKAEKKDDAKAMTRSPQQVVSPSKQNTLAPSKDKALEVTGNALDAGKKGVSEATKLSGKVAPSASSLASGVTNLAGKVLGG